MLIVGNWKMHGLQKEGLARLEKLKALVKNVASVTVVVCPPYTLLTEAAGILKNTSLLLGAQDCHTEASGAFTGDISAEMLKDAGCRYVINGHSERRRLHEESDILTSRKAMAAHLAGLIAILCVGESREEREAGNTLEVIAAQLDRCVPASATGKNTVIAYEPVWAIGSGRTPTPDEIETVHHAIHEHPRCGKMPVLYGGSVTPDNAAEILGIEGVDGVLAGGASLNPQSFAAIASAARGA